MRTQTKDFATWLCAHADRSYHVRRTLLHDESRRSAGRRRPAREPAARGGVSTPTACPVPPPRSPTGERATTQPTTCLTVGTSMHIGRGRSLRFQSSRAKLQLRCPWGGAAWPAAESGPAVCQYPPPPRPTSHGRSSPSDRAAPQSIPDTHASARSHMCLSAHF